MRRLAPSLIALLSACSTVGEPPHDWMLLPAAGVAAVTNGYVGIPGATAAVAAYALYDPLAPNWSIVEQRQEDTRYRLMLRMKLLHSGGDGEAHQIFTRRAEQLAGQPGFDAYEVLRWQEGVDSNRPFAQRVALGEIRLRRAAADVTPSP